VVKKMKKTATPDLRGKSLRFGNIGLRTHVLIFDGFKRKARGQGIEKILTHEDPARWDIVKFSCDQSGKETSFSLATIEFKNPEIQDEYELKPVGDRLVDDVEPEDLPNLRRVLDLVRKHCSWIHDKVYYGGDEVASK
jgi:hypothetical protein